MTYKQAREYIVSLTPRGIVPGLTAVTRLLDALGSPQDRLRCIHIAGTNGKGSVGVFLESMLLADGKSVCRFSSPAVGDYLEMFTYNGTPVSRELYTEAVTDIKSAIPSLEAEGIFPTSFEAETAAAFLMFSRLAPDYALVECGMGGELDATNVITSPAAAVITSISRDHSAFLGNTIAEIASNKAGIIKPGAAVISAPQQQEAADVIEKAAKDSNARLRFAEAATDITYKESKTVFEYKGIEYTIKMLGAYQPQNAALATETAASLGISGAAIQTGLATARLPYRFERVGKFILDGAHNEGAARMMARSLEIYTRPEATAFICGCFRDKDYKRIAELTAPKAGAVYCVKPPTERGLDSAELCRAFTEEGAKAYDCGTIPAAIEAAEDGGYECIVIFGSLSILKEARDNICGHKARLQSKEKIYSMERVNRIYNHPIFQKHIKKITEAERDRKFCLHDLTHALDVARIGRIMILDEGLDIDPELFYAAALLHDAGRYCGLPHNQSGAMLAGKLMPLCGFSDDETWLVSNAIREHRTDESSSDFSRILYTADKRSRNCFCCEAADECYWEDEKRNHNITI